MENKIIIYDPNYNEFYLETDGINIFLFHYRSHTKEKNEDSFILKRTKIEF